MPMKTEDLLLLVKAGFTKEDIAALNQDPEDKQPEPAPKPEAKQPEPEPAPVPAMPDLSGLLKEIQDMKKTMSTLALVKNTEEIKPEKDKLQEALSKL